MLFVKLEIANFYGSLYFIAKQMPIEDSLYLCENLILSNFFERSTLRYKNRIRFTNGNEDVNISLIKTITFIQIIYNMLFFTNRVMFNIKLIIKKGFYYLVTSVQITVSQIRNRKSFSSKLSIE